MLQKWGKIMNVFTFGRVNVELGFGYVSDFKKGAIIFNEGDNVRQACIIIEGEVSISTVTLEGKEYIFNVFHRGDIFGEAALFSGLYFYHGDVIATEDSRIAFLDEETIIHLMKNEDFAREYLYRTSVSMLEARRRIKLLSLTSIKDRILFYLSEKTRFSHGRVVEIETKEKLAKELNIPRPSLSRELIRLKKEKVIDFDRNTITLMI